MISRLDETVEVAVLVCADAPPAKVCHQSGVVESAVDEIKKRLESSVL